jgi:PKD repeat protein
MRKFYLLLTLLPVLVSRSLFAQDSARFDVSVGLNNDVVFTNTSVLSGSDARKAYWSFGDGTRIMTPPLSGATHHYATNGTYTACLRIYKYFTNTHDSVITGEACRSFTLSTTNSDSCRAQFTDTTRTSATSPLGKLFMAQPWHNSNKKPEKICWNFGDGRDTCISYNPLVANEYGVYHAYAQQGTYNVCVKITYQGGCQSTYCRAVLIASGDACRSDFNLERVVASPLSRQIIALPWHVQQKKPVRICWLFGDGRDTCVQYSVSYTGSFNVTHNYANYGQYNVCVKILYDGGCEAQKCKAVTVAAPVPPVDSCYVNIFEVSSSNNHLERHFYAATSPNRIAEKICWNFGDGTDTCINLPNPNTSTSLSIGHRYPGPGVYRLCAKVLYAGGCTATQCRELVIRSATNVCGGYMTDSVTGPRTILFKGFSINNPNDHPVSWRWSFGDGTAATGQQVTHTFAAGGNYEVCLYIKTDQGCETRICKHVTIQATNAAQLQLSPNPVINTLHAVFQSALQEQVTIHIYNANGILVRSYTRAAVMGSNTWDFDLGSLPSGIYSMIVYSGNQLANAIFYKQ